MPLSSPTSVLMAPETPRGTSVSSKAQNQQEHPERNNSFHGNPRSWILQVGVSAGRLCGVANSHLLPQSNNDGDDDDDGNDHHHHQHSNSPALVLAMTDLLVDLYQTSTSLDLNLSVSIRRKLELNNRKYPVELCKGKAGKYTQYSKVTGVTVDNQSTATADETTTHRQLSWAEFGSQVPLLVQEIQDFSEAREWSKFHTPRNIILALLGEVGELAELVQWKGDDNVLSLERKELDKLSQELADVSIYLLRLASVTKVAAALVEQLEGAVID